MNLDFLYEAFGTVLAALYELRHSYAFMIIGLTLIVMVVVTPLTLKATRSMLMMQQLAPEMKRIQSRYKDDRQKLNEELLKFYKENNINPMGSCLPLLVQMPVFFVLYNVLRGLTLRVPTTGSNISHTVGQHLAGVTPTKPTPVVHTFAPDFVPTDSTLFANLSGSTQMRSIGVDLARSASDVFSSSIWQAIPYLVLIVLVAITGVVQQRQIQSRNKDAAINPQQQAIMRVMPFFLPVISFAMPAGLVLYFVVSNTYRVGQQWFISRNIYGREHAGGGASGGAAKGAKPEPAQPGGGGGFLGWLERTLGPGAQAGGSESESEPEPKDTGGKKQPPERQRAKSPAAKSGSGGPRGGGSRAGGAAAKAGRSRGGRATESPGKTGSRNGRSSGQQASGKEKAGTRTSSARGSSGRQSAGGKRSGDQPSGESSGRPPTLQPRARKNRKR